MGSAISGREALSVIDRSLVRTRQAVADAVAAGDALETRRKAISEQRIAAIRALAEVRLDLMEEGEERGQIDAAHREALELLEQHKAFVAQEARALEAAAQAIEALENKRAAIADARDAAIGAYADLVARVEAQLREDEGYRSLVQASEAASAVAARAEQKLELARADRAEKGAVYEADPLFAYLWKRRFRTPEYKASPFFRFLDGWVARLCRYDQHWANYNRLTELPDRLAEHVAHVNALEAEALGRLEAAEAEALKAAGGTKLAEDIAARRSELAEVDLAIEAAEKTHGERARLHEAAAAEQRGPMVDAREKLANMLARASFPELRVLASETLTLEDDQLVDRLVALRSEEMALDINADEITYLPAQRRHELDKLEALRRLFKAGGYDSPHVVVTGAALGRAMDALMHGELDVGGAMGLLKRHLRRVQGDSRGFGGVPQDMTSGIPGILGDVLIEIARQATRGGGGIDIGGGSRRRSSYPRPSSPSRPSIPSRPSGGGGRRGGGGFRTGGGF